MRTATLFTLCAIISVGLALGYGSYGSSFGFIPTFQQAPSTGFGDGTFCKYSYTYSFIRCHSYINKIQFENGLLILYLKITTFDSLSEKNNFLEHILENLDNSSRSNQAFLIFPAIFLSIEGINCFAKNI